MRHRHPEPGGSPHAEALRRVLLSGFAASLAGAGLRIALVDPQPEAALADPADDGREIALTDRRIEAAEAADIGLVTRVVDEATLLDEALDTAQALAGSAIGAFAATRELLYASYGASLEGHLETEAGMIARSSATRRRAPSVADFIAQRSKGAP